MEGLMNAMIAIHQGYTTSRGGEAPTWTSDFSVRESDLYRN